MYHRFAVGERVQLRLALYVNGMPHDVYAILRRLPPEANICQYRVQRVLDGQERVVTENELVKMLSQEGDGQAHSRGLNAQLDLQRIRNVAARTRAQAASSRTNRGLAGFHSC